MEKLCICPEEKELHKYIKLAKENNFELEINVGLIKKKIDSFREFKLGVHGTVGLSFKNLMGELKFLSNLSILYVIYHDSDFSRFSMNDIKKLNEFNFPVLIENYSKKSPQEFSNQYNLLKNEIKNIKKCIDVGHINSYGNKRISEWIDKDVMVVHLHNNYGKDTHNSLFDGNMNLKEVNGYLKKIDYISLEVNRGFDTYLKNIIHLIKFNLVPFENYGLPLNHHLMQKEFAKKLKSILKNIFGEDLIYSFIYGSFSKQNLTKNSDIDLMIILQSKQNIKKFHDIYSKLCSEYGITLDRKYPYEIFTKEDLRSFFLKEHNSLRKKFIKDKEEVLFAFLDKHSFVIGKKKVYDLDCKIVSYLLLDGESSCYNKNEMKKIVRSFMLSGLFNKFNRNIMSETYQRYYGNLFADANKDYNGSKHPHYLIEKEKIIFTKKRKIEVKNLKKYRKGDIIYFSNKSIKRRLSYLKRIDFSNLLNSLPPITSTNTILDHSKIFKLLFYRRKIFVVCELKNPSAYFSNMDKVKTTVQSLSFFRVSPDFVFISENKKNFIITPYHGKTFEDALKENLIDEKKKREIICQLSRLNKLLCEKGLLFGGFAPRNFLLSNDKIFIIDFEKLYSIDYIEKEKIIYTQNFQKIWFSDVLNKKEIQQLFLKGNNLKIEKNNLVKADEVECAYFKNKEITKKQRDLLFNFTRKIECSTFLNDKVIYGHNIGHFFTDNFPPEIEAKIISGLYSVWQNDAKHFKEVMFLFDFLIDFYNENVFRRTYHENINFNISSLSSFIVLILRRLKKNPESIIIYLIFLRKSLPYTKKIPFKIRYNLILKLRRDLEKFQLIHKSDFSKITRFSEIIVKILTGPWSIEGDRIKLINKVFKHSPKNLLIYKSKKFSAVIYSYYGKNRLSKIDSSSAAKLLAELHNINIKNNYKLRIKSEYLNFGEHNVRKIFDFLTASNYKDIDRLKKKINKLSKIRHPRCVIHNDLYYDQFHKDKKGKIRLLDWTYASIGSPFLDLSSILRNDYDERNILLDKNLFIKTYLKNSVYFNKFSFKKIKEGFYINCIRDLIWFIKRLEYNTDTKDETIDWIKDAFDDVVYERFDNFYKDLYLFS